MSLGVFLSDEEIEKFSKYGPPMCAETDPAAFFPQENYDSSGNLLSSSYYDEFGAKALCDACPYKIECLALAIELQAEGIWGGTNTNERKLLVRRMKRAGKSSK